MNKVNCGKCPLFFYDATDGQKCNLDYSIGYIKNQKPGEFGNFVSYTCKLIEIKTEDKIIKPEKLEK